MTKLISVVIATFNGEGVLRGTLSSIAKQVSVFTNEPLDVEILVIDGGSTDSSTRIAKEFGARVLHNPLGHAIAAKYLGFSQAKSEFVCFLDQDERLVSEFSLSRKLQIFFSWPNTVAALTSGYEFGDTDSTSNRYASEFGDPFSLFRYRTPNQNPKRVEVVQKRFLAVKVSEMGFTLFDLGSEKRPTLLEVVATGGVIARRRVLDLCSGSIELNANSLPLLLTLLPSLSPKVQAFIVSDDPIHHKTASTWKQVFKKIRWRVSNATEDAQGIGGSGFRGRTRLEKLYLSSRPSELRYTPLAFLLYVLLFFPIFVDSLQLALSRRRFSYFMNVVLGYYVVYISIALFMKKVFRLPSKIRRYDGTTFS